MSYSGYSCLDFNNNLGSLTIHDLHEIAKISIVSCSIIAKISSEYTKLKIKKFENEKSAKK